jgi:hypothetical protein
MLCTLRFSTALIVVLCVSSASAAEGDAEQYFETHVRPLLVKRCQECHGTSKQQAGLRLDSRAALLAGIEGTPALVPGKPQESRLLQVLAYSEDDTQMPPDGKLPQDEIDVLTKWVADGAVWPGPAELAPGGLGVFTLTESGEIDFAAEAAEHWAYQPIRKPTPPQVAGVDKVRSPIDRFLLARLEAEGLTYSPAADSRTLLRRAEFDLLGLPPTFEQMEEITTSTSPTAYEERMERMLRSMQYGQRWARHWLDIARYADTRGYVFTQNPKYPFAYTYRDYVVRAFNEDKPFDRFIVEQLAADRLGLAADDPDLAALGYLTVGRRFLNRDPDIIDDRIDVVTRGLMGMTVACARCHDHKYDPIPTADYYSLYGVFNSSHEPDELPVIGQPDDSPEYRAYREELAKREQAVTDYIARSHAELLQQLRDRVGDYLQAVVKAAGKLPEGIEPTYEHGDPRESLIRHWSQKITERVQQNDPVFAAWGALAALPVEEFSTKAAELINTYASAPEGESPPINARVWDALRQTPPGSMLDVARMYAALLKQAETEWQALQSAAAEGQAPAALPDEADEQLRRVLTGPGSITDVPAGEQFFGRDHRDELVKLRRKVSEWDSESPGAPPRAMVMRDNDKPAEPVVFLRGTPGRNGPRVPRRFPRILTGGESVEFADGSGRLELARQIASPDNPLTARVIVNRVWRHHFGTGLVATTSDFGTRSDPPTHPELLDWLAASLIEHDWSLKWLHRAIMSSAAYRQSSDDRPDARKVDPENRLLWRMNRKRLEFEPMRDAMLAVAGRLDPAVGGRPVDIEGNTETGRRSIYAFIDRNNFSSLLRTFDYPSPDGHSSGRPLTSVPQQTLFVMNAPFPQQMAAHVAQQAPVHDAATSEERVRVLYRIVLSREPSPEEQQLAIGFLESEGPQKTEQLAQALLLTNEFLFVD